MSLIKIATVIAAGIGAVSLAGCGGGGTTYPSSKEAITNICAEHQLSKQAEGTDIYNDSFLRGRDPETAANEIIETCCPLYAEESTKLSGKELHELAYIRLAAGFKTGDEQSKLMTRRQEIEAKLDKETKDKFWSSGPMQSFNNCRKQFAPGM